MNARQRRKRKRANPYWPENGYFGSPQHAEDAFGEAFRKTADDLRIAIEAMPPDDINDLTDEEFQRLLDKEKIKSMIYIEEIEEE